VFSFTRQVAAWHCPHLPLLLSTAGQQPTDISCPPGAHAAQQQTRIGGVLIMGRTDGQTDRQTDGRSTVTQTLLRVLCGQCQK